VVPNQAVRNLVAAIVNKVAQGAYVFDLASSGWFFLLLFLLFTVCIGLLERQRIADARGFLLTGGSAPAWLRPVAFASAGLGAESLLAAGSAGARFGLSALWFFVLGSLAAIAASGLWFVPLYRRAGARSVPEFLGVRLGRNVRVASAALLAAAAFGGAALLLAAMARMALRLHLTDGFFYALGLPRSWAYPAALAGLAGVVALYVLFSGLAGTFVNQTIQFGLLLAGLLPTVCLGLRNLGGWSGFETALPAALASAAPAGTGSPWLLLAAGLVLGLGFWCVDQRPLQAALGAGSDRAARRTPWIAAPLWLLLAGAMVAAGAIALALPTPQSTTTVREENGAIYHDVTIVPREASAGRGLVPAHLDPATGRVLNTADGRPVLDSALAAPILLGHELPQNLLALGITALLAAFMSGLASGLTALVALALHDIYRPLTQPAAEAAAKNKPLWPAVSLGLARWTTLAAAWLVAMLAGLAGRLDLLAGSAVLDLSLLLLALGVAPVFASVLAAGCLSQASARLVSRPAALAALLAGSAAALLHYGLTLPAESAAGLHGGWLFVLHRYPDSLTQSLATAAIAIAANLAVMFLAVFVAASFARPHTSRAH
jgi:SSS family solute:Na+ symporter